MWWFIVCAMTEDKAEIEVCESLRRLCRTLRSNRARPELAISASRWETKLNERLKELQRQPELIEEHAG